MALNNNNNMSWIESHDSRPSPAYLQPPDQYDGSVRGADHPSSMRSVYSYTRHSPNSNRQTYNSGLFGPRPPPSQLDQMQGFSTPAMVPPPMSELEEADAEYMEVEPEVDLDGPIFDSEFDEEPRSQRKRRFVGGFIRGLRKIPSVMKRGFLPGKREVLTPPGLMYHQSPYRSPYIHNTLPEEAEEAPPYDAPSEHVDGDLRYMDTINMPSEFMSDASPSRTPSHTIQAPRSESQLTYQSLTNPPARHISQHGSLHHTQRSSPPRTVRNPDPPSPTDESRDITGTSPRPSQHPPELEAELESRLSPEPTRRPTVTVQSPTGSPVYIEPQRADDYAGMDMDSSVESTSEPPASSQLSRIGRFFRDLNNLPWVSPNVTVDFDPTEAERSRHTHVRGPDRSWYTGHLDDLDILGGGSSSRIPIAPSGHSLRPAPGSSATLAPHHGSGSASSSEGASAAHLPSTHTHHYKYPFPVPTLALPPQPLYLYPYPAVPPPPPPARKPDRTEQMSPQSSGHSDVPQQPYLFVVAIPPGYMPGPVDTSRPMQPASSVPHSPPV
ncbi:hypothetical protein BC826DRAFT_56618 [Russula brevipes]|nr:hypothetical protein BC826DRAFT_56618 [Russula brevipes]